MPDTVDGTTPLITEEEQGLIPTWVTTHGELDQAEQENINAAQQWLKARRPSDVLTEHFVSELHRHMFDDVWSWAGQFRRTNKNIGVEFYRVPVELRELLANVKAWIEHTAFPWDEIGARFHHRLVLIHCFPNGNGRHARLATDALLVAHHQTAFTWGASGDATMQQVSPEVRERYIRVLKQADGEKYDELLSFVRS